MLPLIQTDELKNSVVEYLKATFNFNDRIVEQAFADFLFHNRYGMFKGPYMQIRLPYKKLEHGVNLSDVLDIYPNFTPYIHQYEAFKRLSTKTGNPKPVILTTGTGSGKTESFLFPLLDYCHKHSSKPGIKAIILYPMNALATDQARRLANEIYTYQDAEGNYLLRDKIRAGLLIGEGKNKAKERATRMEEDRIIEDRDTIKQAPPDILLTNFKMLDFALMKAEYNNLWKHNYNDNSLLKFIVLDELHTYDGAKGSDVANLIRRLKLKLNISDNNLVPVGTSATMGGGEEGKEELVKFFSMIFGTEQDTNSVIEEQREDPDLFFNSIQIEPDINLSNIGDCNFTENDDYESYLARQLKFWSFSAEYEPLLEELRSNRWLYELVSLCSNSVIDVWELNNQWLNRCTLNQSVSQEQGIYLLQSLTAVLAYAKEQSGKRLFPFVYFQTIYWVRSLFRVLRRVQPSPVFLWETDINTNDDILSLPPYYCRECGGSGWLAIKKENEDFLEKDFSKVRNQFMSDGQNKNVYFISSLEGKAYNEVFAADYSFTGDPIEGYLNPKTLTISERKEKEYSFKIFGVRRQNDTRIEKVCPHCNERDTLGLIGTGLPTLESIMVAQLMATASDPSQDHERKLLAFTNGVQDAAHQAGFIENRNFRFSMRHAIQTALKEKGGRLALPTLYKEFEDVWHQKLQSEPDSLAYIHKFLPPDCEPRISFNDLKKDRKFKDEFLKELSHRVSWEIWSEYTFNAAIGRTLEKSGASAVEFDSAIFREIYGQLKYWMQTNNLSERVDEIAFHKFVLGFLHRLRLKGGVDHEYLKKYRTEKTNYYLITQNTNKHHFLIKNFGKNSRLPKFASLDTYRYPGAYEIIKTKNQTHNWFSTWFRKCFPMVNDQEYELVNDFFEQFVAYLEANNLLDKKVAAGINNSGIKPEQIFITTQVKSFECKVCGHLMNLGENNASIAEGMPCLQYRCTGTYTAKNNNEFDYYRMVYNRGRGLRIFAKDHTGLIDRDKREALERDFKKRPAYNSTNVLVATSTLEMGIDIGDLNVAINASIPPETANYLQRVGRAGRATGTSLIVNIAGRDEHDQFFFADTMAMMQGEVKTPACYLGAKDILKRHFMAYCFDMWALDNPEEHHIPPIVRLLRLKSLPIGDSRFVFNSIAGFIEKNQKKLFETFRSKYVDNEPLEALKEIEIDLDSGQLLMSLTELHQKLLIELHFYAEKQKDVKNQLKDLPETSNESKDLKRELKAISTAINCVNVRNTVEYLTNTGILPNYAFPETGISLKAQIINAVEEDGKLRYKSEDFGEIIRPASGGLTELAPGNVFYSQGYKLQSQGIEVFSDDSYEVWRFCSNCDALELDVKVQADQTSCPKCGHSSWGSGSNKKTFIKFKGASSVVNKVDGRINDGSEERERVFYCKSLHLKADPQSSSGARILKRVPFGIEYFKVVDYYEINTGKKDEFLWGTHPILINERENPEIGFVVCKNCGKATERKFSKNDLKNINLYHFGFCRNKSIYYNPENEDSQEVFREVYLYRNFKTEAIKILLPVQEFRSAERVSVFKSGLLLGLKAFYKGHPDHINIREYEEFNKESGRKEKFLIMYETIPGGTGYLSRLFDTEEFTNLLNVAYEHIKHCSCKDEGKDGCYKCIYTYANQYERESLSRHEAEMLFQEIVEKASEWNEVTSLSNLTRLANQEESELEEKFIELLRDEYNKDGAINFQEKIEEGKRRYRLTLENENNSICYDIWPQNLGRKSLLGVKYTTRPDFVFKCISLSIDGVSQPFDKCQEVQDVVVYLDGYAYHAQEPHKRVLSDLKIRDAIVQNEKYNLWIFTWDDIVNRGNNSVNDSFYKLQNINGFKGLFQKHPKTKNISFSVIESGLNNFKRFVNFLKTPIDNIDIRLWSSVNLFAFQEKILKMCIEPAKAEDLLESGILSDFHFESSKPEQLALMHRFELDDELKLIVLANPSNLETITSVFHQEPVDAYNKDNWELFWHIYNFTQFHGYRGIERQKSVDRYSVILENFRDELHLFVKELIDSKIEINEEYDFDLLENGVIVAQAELGSHQSKFFMYPFDDESEIIFKKNGYRKFTIESFNIKKL